jgi:hypothetical protein
VLLPPPATGGRKTSEVRHRRAARKHAAPCGREPERAPSATRPRSARAASRTAS